METSEDETFKRLKQSPFDEVRKGYKSRIRKSSVEEMDRYLSSHGWTWQDYIFSSYHNLDEDNR